MMILNQWSHGELNFLLFMLLLNLPIIHSRRKQQEHSACTRGHADSAEPRCSCEHNEGRFTANCVGRNLTQVPFGIPEKVISLRMDNNILNSLTEPAYFRKRGLGNLLELYLKSCEISEIGDDAFFHLPILRTLDLSRNKISSLPDLGLSRLNQLRRIDLSENIIQDVKPKMFGGLPLVEEIDLSNNRVRFIYKDAFKGLIKLRTVRLESNKLLRISQDVFNSLPNLQVVGMTSNPWICDCFMHEFWMWEKEKKLSEPPSCNQPEHIMGKRWDQLQRDDLACQPRLVEEDLSSDKTFLTVWKGSSVSFACPVFGDPKPQFSWEFRSSNHSSIEMLRNSGGKITFTEQKKPSKFHVWINTIEISNVGPDEEGIYTCSAKNKGGSVVEIFQLRLHLPPTTTNPTEVGGVIAELRKSGDLWLIVVVSSTAVLIVVVLVSAVCCYRRGGGQRSSPVYASVNGYGYHQVINGPAAAPEKPPRSNLEDYYVTDPDALYELPPASSDKQKLTVMFADDPAVHQLQEDDSGYLEDPAVHRTNLGVNVHLGGSNASATSSYGSHTGSSTISAGTNITNDSNSPRTFVVAETHNLPHANNSPVTKAMNGGQKILVHHNGTLGNRSLERNGIIPQDIILVNGKAPLAQGEKEEDMKMPLRETAL